MVDWFWFLDMLMGRDLVMGDILVKVFVGSLGWKL